MRLSFITGLHRDACTSIYFDVRYCTKLKYDLMNEALSKQPWQVRTLILGNRALQSNLELLRLVFSKYKGSKVVNWVGKHSEMLKCFTTLSSTRVSYIAIARPWGFGNRFLLKPYYQQGLMLLRALTYVRNFADTLLHACLNMASYIQVKTFSRLLFARLCVHAWYSFATHCTHYVNGAVNSIQWSSLNTQVIPFSIDNAFSKTNVRGVACVFYRPGAESISTRCDCERSDQVWRPLPSGSYVWDCERLSLTHRSSNACDLSQKRQGLQQPHTIFNVLWDWGQFCWQTKQVSL